VCRHQGAKEESPEQAKQPEKAVAAAGGTGWHDPLLKTSVKLGSSPRSSRNSPKSSDLKSRPSNNSATITPASSLLAHASFIATSIGGEPSAGVPTSSPNDDLKKLQMAESKHVSMQMNLFS
jgi:hypothetical protein